MCRSTGLAAVINWEEVSVVGFIVFFLVLLSIFKALGKDKWFSNVKVGFFVERRHESEDLEPAWDQIPEEWWAWLEDYLKANPPDWRLDDEPGDEGRDPEAPRPPRD